VSYKLSRSSSGFTIALAAASREELVRDLITALLDASYGETSPGTPGAGTDGQFVPIQASGNDERELLTHLTANTLRAVADTDGVLLPPRWLSFDEKRATANLPVVPGAARPRPEGLPSVRASVAIESGLPAFRATVSLAAGARAA
jgi:hypothetical protein